MKTFVENWNGVLDTLIDTLESRDQLTDNPHDADVFLLWQDVRGTCNELANIAKYHLKKPVLVMQHGRGATRDYCPPNKFTLLADKILVWGETEKNRLLANGITESRIDVVGCPLFNRLKPKAKERHGVNVLFAPVIAMKEEPENLLVYSALKEWESRKLRETIYRNFDGMKKAWAWEQTELKEVALPDGTKEKRVWKKQVSPSLPRWLTYEAGLINVKLSGVHDVYQYQSPLIVSNQNDPHLIDGLVEILANTDVVVCLEEGTMQLLAHAMDIPVIVADIFRYENYGGCENYDTVEKIHTNACYWTKNVEKIGDMIDHVLKNKTELRKHRIKVCEDEGGAHLGDADQRIINVIESFKRTPEAVPV